MLEIDDYNLAKTTSGQEQQVQGMGWQLCVGSLKIRFVLAKEPFKDRVCKRDKKNKEPAICCHRIVRRIIPFIFACRIE